MVRSGFSGDDALDRRPVSSEEWPSTTMISVDFAQSGRAAHGGFNISRLVAGGMITETEKIFRRAGPTGFGRANKKETEAGPGEREERRKQAIGQGAQAQ